MALSSLVYVSIASRDMNAYELIFLLMTARENNTQKDITGMLLYRDGFFIQALEGEEEVITTLFEKIKLDKRHHTVLLLYKEPITRREFPDWTMGFELLTGDSFDKLEGFSQFMQNPPLGKYGALALKMGSEVKLLLEKFRR